MSKRVDAKTMYVVTWIMDECDEEHQSVDPRTLDRHEVAEMVETATEAWNAGAGDND